MLFTCSGATCFKHTRNRTPFAPPVVFETEPSKNELATFVNRSLKIQSLESHNLKVTSPDVLVPLQGSLRWARPDQFQLESFIGNRLTGTALGAGSNSEQFWFQVSRPDPRIYVARHDEFDQQAGPRTVLPVSPLWLREAMGVIEFDPQFSHEGPIVRADGNLEMRSYIPSRRGDYRRHVVMNPKTATILETMLYDHTGRMVAISKMSKHQEYADLGYSLPHHVDIRLFPAGSEPLQFSVQIGSYLVNQLTQEEIDAFRMPDTRGLTEIDLVRANSGVPNAAQPPKYTSAAPVYQSTGPTLPQQR